MVRNSVNSKGRTFMRRKSIGESLRVNIIKDIVAEGGDPASGYLAGEYKQVADQYRGMGPFVSK